MAAPPAGRPSRGSVRRGSKTPDGRGSAEPSPSPIRGGGSRYFASDGEGDGPPDGALDGGNAGGGARREDSVLTGLVSDSLGPKIVQGAHEVTEMMTKQLEHWSHLHTLLQASLSEREQLMHTVARLEQDCDRVRKAREVDAAKHSQHVKDIYARMQREQTEALEAAAKEAEYVKAKALHLLQQEEERKRADAVAEVAEAAERDKALALAAAKESSEQELMEALSVARQRAEEEKLEALSALRQRDLQEKRQALLQQAQAHEEEKQTAVAIALERADALRERVVAEEREIALKERKKALAVERDTQQKDKYRALAEERERAKLALARVEALDQERQREEQTKLALERAARTERATCRNCGLDFVVDQNAVGECKCVHNGSTSQVHVEGLLWHTSAELTNWVKMRRRWSCCPHKEIMGTYADLVKLGCRAHQALPT